jgi:hydrophobic/amphiphilic exporter-1 (mainly G- bacteria), HAE1 family
MQKLAEICIRRPVFATMLILALVVVGSVSYTRLNVDRFPSVDMPSVTIRTSLPGASPAEMEALVSQRIEEAVNTVAGIKELRSISGAGSSYVIVTFELNRNIDTATQDVRDRMATVVRHLPREADPPVVSKLDNDMAPIMSIALAGDRSLRELTEIADKIVKVQLERSEGVGEVEIIGGRRRAINVWIDSDRLAAYQIPITAVREAIVRQNAEMPGGHVTSGRHEQTLRTLGRILEPRDFNDLVVATIDGSPVRVRDIGSAEDGTREPRSLARLNGVPTVTLDIRRQSGANTVAVIEGIKSKLALLEGQLPDDVHFEIIRDQSTYIYEALRQIRVHLILGSALACLVVLAFMRNWRATVIAGAAIPASVIATFGMMWALNFTLNSVTMLALVLMVGVVIDDAIVVLENIFRFVEEKKMGAFEAARAATAEIGMAVMATTFSLVVIFVPVSFMSSISGRFLFQFGLTAAVAVLVSLVVSFSLTPMMSARLLKAKGEAHGGPESRRGFYGAIERVYMWLLGGAMRHRALVVVLAGLVVLSSVPLYKQVKQDYIPGNTDEGDFDVFIRAPEGASLGAMEEVLDLLEKELGETRGVQLVLAAIGGGFAGSVNQARAYVRLAPHGERTFSIGRLARGVLRGDPLEAFRNNYTVQDVVRELRQRLRKYPDLRPSVRMSRSFNLGGANAEIDFSLLGPDLLELAEYIERLRLRAPELGIVDADTTLKLDTPELRVEINRERAAALGVEMADIATALRLMVGGDQRVSRFRDETLNEDYDVQLRLKAEDRDAPETIARLFVPRQGGGLVRLDNLVELVPGTMASRIDRLDRQRQVSLRASVGPGYALADRLQALRQAASELDLPAAYTTRVSGRGRELETTANEFLWAFLLSVVFMYMILAAQYESMVHPFTILLSLPLSLPFALLSLWGTNNTLNLYSALGMLVLFGVVKKNAILQIDHMNKLRAQGLERLAAIMQGNRDRLRPILMTTFTLVAGMLPLALGTGPGAEERRAVAVVVIGGQSLCLLLTLLVTPVVYSYLDDIGARLHWRRVAGKVKQTVAATRAPKQPAGV